MKTTQTYSIILLGRVQRCAGCGKGASENVLEVYPFECGYDAGSELKLELKVE
jgi:hypothetical protein